METVQISAAVSSAIGGAMGIVGIVALQSL